MKFTENKLLSPLGSKKNLKRILVIFLVLICLALGILVVERLRGNWAYNNRIKELKQSSEVLDYKHLVPANPSPKDNVYVALAALTNSSSTWTEAHEYFPPSIRFNQSRQALEIRRLENWKSGGKTNTWEQFHKSFNEIEEVIPKLEEASQRPYYDSGFDYKTGFLDFKIGSLVNVKRATDILGAATLAALQKEKFVEAHQHLTNMLNLVNVQKEPILICQLVAQAGVINLFNTTWQFLQTKKGTAWQLQQIQSQWLVSDFQKQIEKAMEMERNLTIDLYDRLASSGSAALFLIEQHEKTRETMPEYWTFPTEGFILKHLHLPIWRFSWVRQDALRSLDRWNVMIGRTRFARTNSWKALLGDPLRIENNPEWPFPPYTEQSNIYDRVRYLFSSSTFSVTDRMILRASNSSALQILASTAIAIERYRLSTGSLPTDIKILTPEYLPKTPLDPMDGKTLRYKVIGEKSFRLYSVGENGTDEKGNPGTADKTKEFPQVTDGLDIVWPEPAP